MSTILFCFLLIIDKQFRSKAKGFSIGKRNIGYNFGIDDGAEQKFGTRKELIVLNIFQYKFFVNKMSRDYFAKNRKLLTNWWPVEKELSNNTFLIYIKYF